MHRSGSRRYLLLAVILFAFFLRTYRLVQVPAGVDYDEAGNLLLAREIAIGKSHPVFIRAYAGREAVFYWLTAAVMRLAGGRLFAIRLTAALCGVAAVLFGYLLARDMFGDEGEWEREWLPLLAAAMMAVSYWPVHVNRYGFRVNSMPPLVAATMTFLWRGLRRGRWRDLAVGGALCGLAANTYLAVRALPLVLFPFALWAVLAWRTDGFVLSVRRRLSQFALFGVTALITLAPLALFFLRHPQYFSVRMSQASIFELYGDDWRSALDEVTRRALGMFTIRGDENPVYNLPGRPIFGPLLGAFFYLGLAICLWRAFTRRERAPYVLILLWLPIMLLPNILGARGVPHNLRSMSLLPVIYYLPALGLTALVGVGKSVSRALPTDWLMLVLTLALLAVGGWQTFHQYFGLWARDPGAYYRGAADLRHEAAYLSQWNPDEVTLIVGNDTYRHTTLAAFCSNYSHLKWMRGPTLVFTADDRPALYAFDHTNLLDPVLARYLPPDTLQHRELGPDGKVGFEAYLLPPDRRPDPYPQVRIDANLGNVLTLIGYDLNRPPVSGETLDVTLYWRVNRRVERDDYTFFAHLVDDLGFRWGGETFFYYPSLQWRPGEVVLFRLTIAIAPGAPPDDYTLNVGVFSPSLDARLPLLDEQGQMAGTVARLGPIAVAAATTLPQELPPIQRRLDVHFPGGLTLLGRDRDRSELRPGETLALSLYWQVTAPVREDLQVSLELVKGEKRVVVWEGAPVRGGYPFSRWEVPALVRDRYALRLPTDLEAGEWELRLSLLRPDRSRLRVVGGGDEVVLCELRVRASERRWEVPALTHEVGARLGDVVELVGYDLWPDEVSVGGVVHLRLVWRCLQEMEVGYTVFTHLLGEDGRVWGQQDNPPVGGRYPTTLWVAGEVVVDEYELTVKEGAPAGEYVLEVGMYDPADLRRLPVMEASGEMGDRVLLGHVRVTGRSR